MTARPVETIDPEYLPAVRDRVARIEAQATADAGHPSLGEAAWRDLGAPGPDSAGFIAGDAAYVHVARQDNASATWALGLTATPEARNRGVGRALLKAALEHVHAHGGGRVTLWVLGAHPADDDELAGVGLEPDRDLYEMRVPLPIAERPARPPGITVRPFEPGRDDADWIEVNNRAFATHAEQGGWTKETLARRIAEPWFDPSLFLCALDADGLAGFNWLRLHTDGGERLGEIYVIGVDPRMQGCGLGRALAIEGLDAVHARGVATGSLFVAADNEAALRLYRELGFTVRRTDRAYEREVVAR